MIENSASIVLARPVATREESSNIGNNNIWEKCTLHVDNSVASRLFCVHVLVHNAGVNRCVLPTIAPVLLAPWIYVALDLSVWFDLAAHICTHISLVVACVFVKIICVAYTKGYTRPMWESDVTQMENKRSFTPHIPRRWWRWNMPRIARPREKQPHIEIWYEWLS